MNYRQKKRIKDSAGMVKNVRDLRTNMDKLSTEYSKDLESFFSAFTNHFNKKEIKSQSDTPDEAHSNELVSYHQEQPDHLGDDCDSTDEAKKKGKQAPPRSKKPLKITLKQLYRKVMQKCHPDRIINDDKVTEAQKVVYAYVLEVAMNAYKAANTADLIYAAALVDIYPQKMSMKECLDHLNKLYSENSGRIDAVQKSLSWAWGVNWDTLEVRYNIVVQMCARANIPIPDKPDVLKFLIDFETS